MSNDPNGEFLKAQPHGGGFDFDKREPGNPHGGDFDKPGNLIIYTNNTEK